jgi:hypothetical protein
MNTLTSVPAKPIRDMDFWTNAEQMEKNRLYLIARLGDPRQERSHRSSRFSTRCTRVARIGVTGSLQGMTGGSLPAQAGPVGIAGMVQAVP